MARKDITKDSRKATDATRAQVQRASEGEAKAEHMNSTRDMVACAARRMGVDGSTLRTVQMIEVADPNCLGDLFRVTAMEAFHLMASRLNTETFYRTQAENAEGSGQPPERGLMKEWAEQTRQFSTGINRALQTMAVIQRAHADQHLADVPSKVEFSWDLAGIVPPPTTTTTTKAN